MNPRLTRLQAYPFERLRVLLDGVAPTPGMSALDLSIGEPKHPTPALLLEAMCADPHGLARYPATAGSAALRTAIADWLGRRFGPARIDPDTEVLPVLGSREALFSFAQVVLGERSDELVVSPNPFYQIYEGAAFLGGAQPHYVPLQTTGHTVDWLAVPAPVWARTRLVFVCSPGNPTGAVMKLDEWRLLFELSDRYGFTIAADECYSEIYRCGAPPPLGSLQAAATLGRGFERLVAFGSLSKRSNAPGLRSGYAAGDAALIAEFLRYRTYHGSAMSPVVQAASIAAWNDETHVEANRRAYDEKFAALEPLLAPHLDIVVPEGGFYFWAGVPGGDDLAFGRELFRQYNVRTLPGSFIARASASDDLPGPSAARAAPASNPGAGRVRLALVEPLQRCLEAAERVARFCAGEGAH